MRKIAPVSSRIHLSFPPIETGAECRLRSALPTRLTGYHLDRWLTVTLVWRAINNR